MVQIPTMQHIAELAGVSKSTVSRALADDPRVNQQTKARIKKIAAELNYRPNPVASGLANKRTYTLGLVIPLNPRSISDPFYLEFIGGVGDFAITKGYSLLLSSLYPTACQTPSHVLMAEGNRVDGLILTEPLADDPRVTYLHDKGIPFVFLGNSGPSPDLYWVNGDNIAGVKAAIAHLVESGHHEIGCIAGSQQLKHGQERLIGYKEALQEAGLPYSDQRLVEADFTEHGGYQGMQQLLKQAPQITAVFAANDLMAIGALRAIKEAQLQVPNDIALVGFDGITLTQYTSPPLTTIRQPIYEMGFLAAEMLVKIILGEPITEPQVLLPLELVVRGSS